MAHMKTLVVSDEVSRATEMIMVEDERCEPPHEKYICIQQPVGEKCT